MCLPQTILYWAKDGNGWRYDEGRDQAEWQRAVSDLGPLPDERLPNGDGTCGIVWAAWFLCRGNFDLLQLSILAYLLDTTDKYNMKVKRDFIS